MRVAPWVEWVEDRFGAWAIPHVTRYLVGLNLATYLLEGLSPGFTQILILDQAAILSGEIWRIATFILVPAVKASPLFFLIFLWFTWFVGDYLESEWGPAKLNLFYLTGIASLTLVSLLFVPGPIRNDLLLTSLILPFGTVFPTMTIMLFFVLPVQARWLAIIYAGFLALALLFGADNR
ncbi:MAG: hypothetical protein SNJ84_04855, partial [Verrucomicrobiia bacterium]